MSNFRLRKGKVPPRYTERVPHTEGIGIDSLRFREIEDELVPQTYSNDSRTEVPNVNESSPRPQSN